MAELNNKRQRVILGIIQKNPGLSSGKIFLLAQKEVKEKLSKITIIRDLQILLDKKLIKKEGRARAVKYFEVVANKLVSYFDVEDYFKNEVEKRKIEYSRFNFEIFKKLSNLVSSSEVKQLVQINNDFVKRIKNLPSPILKKEIERLTIELAWKSSQIEGNTYSLIDTEILIKQNKPARGKSQDETQMILNHKRAIDFIFSHKNYFKKLTVGKIEDLHSMIVDKMGVSRGFRKRVVGITGTKYEPLDNQHQIREAMEKLVEAVNKLKDPLEKAMVINLMIAYIQPFEDGNKRTSRILGDAILNSYNYCPLSYRSIDEAEYKKAILVFYEKNNIYYFKQLFMQQFRFAIENYLK